MEEQDIISDGEYTCKRCGQLGRLKIYRSRNKYSPMQIMCEGCFNELSRGKAWYRIKKKVLERDSYVCKECSGKEEFEPGWPWKPWLEVHHILPLSKGGKDTMDNLITLCFICHRRKDKH